MLPGIVFLRCDSKYCQQKCCENPSELWSYFRNLTKTGGNFFFFSVLFEYLWLKEELCHFYPFLIVIRSKVIPVWVILTKNVGRFLATTVTSGKSAAGRKNATGNLIWIRLEYGLSFKCKLGRSLAMILPQCLSCSYPRVSEVNVNG